MFKAIKDNKIIAFNETGDFPCMVIGSDIDEIVEDTEHQMSDYVMVENEFVLDTDAKAIEKQKENVRDVRNSYMKQYVDYYQEKPLMWVELDDEFKQKIIDYRQYLKDYPESNEEWYLSNPKTFEEWSKEE